jgi:hypothetical protein
MTIYKEAKPEPLPLPCGPKLLFADTETSPSITYAWSYWNTSITADKIIKPSELIAWSALWYDPEDNAEVMFHSIHHDGKEQMIQEIWQLLDEADILCCFNTRFDAAKLNHAFLLAGLPPPSPYKKTCLMQVCKKVFSFSHNSLRNVLSVLGLDEQKMENEGFALWVKCLEGDEQAWADMRAYSIQDTAVLRGLYLKLLPWIPNLPNFAAYEGKDDHCPACGSPALMKEGFAHTSTSRYQRFRCSSCGKWSKGNKQLARTNVTQLAG